MFVVAMLLSVSAWASEPNEKEKKMDFTYPQDTEQVKCKITAKICGKEHSWTISTTTQDDCDQIQGAVFLASLFSQNCD